jgi:acetyltransferase-like isoleucine patch superfamily enzyme
VTRGIKNRLLQALARWAPGHTTVRVWLHRQRGVTIGRHTSIGADAIIETERPELISIGNGVQVGIRDVIIGHFRAGTPAERGEEGVRFSVVIEDDVYLGPGVIILPGSTIGHGSVVTAGSVVTVDVQPMTVVQGNPARPVARCGVPLGMSTPLDVFYASLRPIRPKKQAAASG